MSRPLAFGSLHAAWLRKTLGACAAATPMLAALSVLPGLAPAVGQTRWSAIGPLQALVAAVVVGLGITLGLGLRRKSLHRFDALLLGQAAEKLRFDTTINNISQGLCFFDGKQRLIVCNHRYAEMYGLSHELVRPGTTLREIVDHRYAAGSFPDMTREQYLAWRTSISISATSSDTISNLKNGRVIAIHHQPMPDGGWVATHEDVTERRLALAQIEHMARSDALTGLANRVQFRERLTELQMPDEADADADATAVLLVDLDRFKSVNDTLGHPVGDQLLRAAAQRLKLCVRHGDLVARLGGDEFAIVQVGATQPAAARSLAERLVRELAVPFEVDGHQVLVGASVGVALAKDEGSDPDELLKKADLALYDAKAAGRGTYSFFRTQMVEQAKGRRALEIDLRVAESRGELELHYQPIVDLATQRVVCLEALLRWRHPERGMVMPDSFIPLAEETGLIEPLGAWVLREAFEQARGWPAEVSIAVNLSPVQFKSGNLRSTVAAALRASGIAPQRVELEITESVRLAENSANLAVLHELRALGVRICLDDFGVGYSSLSYLRSFPFSKIKIDRSFVREICSSHEAAAIVRAITTLGDSLDMTITAEGIEQETQLDLLRGLGCDQAQGYLFSTPRPIGEVQAMLRLERGLRLVAGGRCGWATRAMPARRSAQQLELEALAAVDAIDVEIGDVEGGDADDAGRFGEPHQGEVGPVGVDVGVLAKQRRHAFMPGGVGLMDLQAAAGGQVGEYGANAHGDEKGGLGQDRFDRVQRAAKPGQPRRDAGMHRVVARVQGDQRPGVQQDASRVRVDDGRGRALGCCGRPRAARHAALRRMRCKARSRTATLVAETPPNVPPPIKPASANAL